MRIRLKTIFVVIAAVLVVGYVVVMSVLPKKTESESVKCHTVECVFKDSVRYRYISPGQVRKYLHQVGCYPVGTPLEKVQLQTIEDTLCAHPIIATADCYMSADGTMHIELTQRCPIAHVVNDKESYFVATDRQLMPVWSTIKDSVLRVRGRLTHEQSCHEVADFAEWVQKDSVWRSRIAYLNLAAPHQYVLYMRGDTTQYVLGDLHNYEAQLHRLSVFESQLRKLPKQHFGKVDLRFDNQVVTCP